MNIFDRLLQSIQESLNKKKPFAFFPHKKPKRKNKIKKKAPSKKIPRKAVKKKSPSKTAGKKSVKTSGRKKTVKKPVAKTGTAEKAVRKTGGRKQNSTAVKKKTVSKKESRKKTGLVTHYFDKIQVAVIELKWNGLKIGDMICVDDGKASFRQKVHSMQVESEDIKSANKGKIIGMKIKKKAGVGAVVYRV